MGISLSRTLSLTTEIARVGFAAGGATAEITAGCALGRGGTRTFTVAACFELGGTGRVKTHWRTLGGAAPFDFDLALCVALDVDVAAGIDARAGRRQGAEQERDSGKTGEEEFVLHDGILRKIRWEKQSDREVARRVSQQSRIIGVMTRGRNSVVLG